MSAQLVVDLKTSKPESLLIVWINYVFQLFGCT